MGAEWDGNKGGRDTWIAWLAERLAEACRILPAGACGLVWALPRTSHWTALACEHAGFQIADRVSHIFGSGFPKHKYALKPAVEDWWLVQKPGAARRLNVDACRVGTNGERIPVFQSTHTDRFIDRSVDVKIARTGETHSNGRWPAHLVLSHSPTCNGVCSPDCPIRVLGEQSGERPSGGNTPFRIDGMFMPGQDTHNRHYKENGTAARFFPNLPADDAPPFIYAPKASRRERNAGCEGLEPRPVAEHDGRNPMMNG
ncbi:MAG TPA: hypothetical protein VFT99_04755, partial [Roseiflexaceae bacterium]|nr:hypothetical protein [Roseiflexaceae bacterium]